ncbi:hypothetical protein [Aneurinibacillus tyrosinisolvens]|uniref:hypothetical protein n=1 Tax=Aneurinibacillus tyrosinisolvens TaxID=1443435 RepID=UPI00063ED780|nr:hypothetical protein [Aneurinibacillus tyrosinisolvens]
MKLIYEYNQDDMEVTEKKNGKDTDFQIKIKNTEYLPAIHKVRSFFDHNKIHTDVLFYTLSNNTYQVIVREDYYTDFITTLFKYHLVLLIRWE